MQLHWHLRFSLRDYRQRTNTYRELWENKWMLLCLSLCINCYSSNYKHWMTENKVSPTIFPVYCLERVRGHGSERKKPSRIQHTPSLEQPEVIVRWDQGKRAHRTEERDTHREITPAFCKGFPLDDRHLHVKKLHKALEKIVQYGSREQCQELTQGQQLCLFLPDGSEKLISTEHSQSTEKSSAAVVETN